MKAEKSIYQDILKECCYIVLKDLEVEKADVIYSRIISLIRKLSYAPFQENCDQLFMLFNKINISITNQIQKERKEYISLSKKEKEYHKSQFIKIVSDYISILINLNKLNSKNIKIKIMEASILYTKMYDQDVSKAYQEINNTIQVLLNDKNINVNPYDFTKRFHKEMMYEIDSIILESLIQQYQSVIDNIGTYKEDIAQYQIIKDNTNESIYKNFDNSNVKEIPISLIFKSSIIILIIILIYSAFPRPFFNIDITLLCIILMISTNWIQRIQYGEEPKLSEYNFFWDYLIGGIYAILPVDLNPDIIPFIGSIDDVIVVWLLTFYCLIAER